MQPRTKTRFEARVADALIAAGYSIETNVLFESPGLTLELDVYLPQYHVGIELNGPIHVLRAHRDSRRLAHLNKTHNLPVLTLSYDELPKEELDAKRLPKRVRKKIDGFIKLWKPTAEERRASV